MAVVLLVPLFRLSHVSINSQPFIKRLLRVFGSLDAVYNMYIYIDGCGFVGAYVVDIGDGDDDDKNDDYRECDVKLA